MADITTTTEEEGERMSELANTIDRLEQWVEYWEPHQPAEFIADLKVLIGAAKAVNEPVKITLGTRVVVEIGGADFDVGTVMRFEWSPVDYDTTRIANPDGTFTTRTVGATMRLELTCDLPIVVEP